MGVGVGGVATKWQGGGGGGDGEQEEGGGAE